jgi:hypothetical protein
MRRAAKEWPTSSPDESQKLGTSRAVLASEPLTWFRCPGGAAVLLPVQADAAGDRRPARRLRNSTASCCCQHNAYQRAQISWTTSSASEPRQPARPTPNSKYEPLIGPATCSRSKQISGDDHPCITRYGSLVGRVWQRVLYATWCDGERAANAGLRLPCSAA